MLTAKDYEKAHKDYPFSIKYKNTPERCNHAYNFCVFCNGERDILRCQKCGSEIECQCNFDNEYD